MISRAIHLKPAIEDICTKRSLVSQYNTGPYKLKREEWEILEELSPLLGVCDFITLFAHAFPILVLLHLVGFSRHLT